MKKQLLVLLSFFITISTYAQSHNLEQDPDYLRAKDEVLLLRKRFGHIGRGALRGAQWGAAFGALAGAKHGYKDAMEFVQALEAQGINFQRNQMVLLTLGMYTPVYAATLAGMGAVSGAMMYMTYREGVLLAINQALVLNHTKYNFMTMSLSEAIMTYAAFKENISLMRKMKPHVDQFLNKEEVLKALTQLYFGAETPENVKKLKGMLG